MAQWNGQYTGNTHGTKVSDLEHVLTHAVEAFKAAPGEVRPAKAKAVRKLVTKVLNARLKMVKAKLYDKTPVEAKDWEKRRVQIEHLEKIETDLISSGVAGILFEFGVADLVGDCEP